MAELTEVLRADGHTITRLDLGGGLGIPYERSNTDPPLPSDYGALVRRTLGHLGCSDVKTAGTVDVADGMIRPGCFDFALLDMNLRGNVPFPLAFKLRDLGVPFCFVTGYGSDIERPAALADVQILTKTINQTMLTQALSRMLA